MSESRQFLPSPRSLLDPDLLEHCPSFPQQPSFNVRSHLEKEGFPCEIHLSICNMTPGEHLVLFAEQNEIDEIVIGVKMKSKVGKFLLGSTAQQVILTAPCPVVSVK